MMKIESVRAEIKNVNPRKEKGEDGDRLASDVSMEFTVPKGVINDLFKGSFMDQFFTENGDVILESVCPVTYQKKVEDLKLDVALDGGIEMLEFSPVKIAKGMKLEPTMGGYVVVDCKFQIYPSDQESGRLDAAVKDYVDIAVAPLNMDIDD